MSRQMNSFKLGLFMISGVILLTVVLAVLGAGKIFENYISLETYINESVNGLEVGSPIKYRGVKIGSVAEIGFVTDHYSDVKLAERRYVYIRGNLYSNLFSTKEGHDILDELLSEVQNGLRTRPVSVGLTGQLFLEVDFFDPKKNPPLEISWTPEGLYIPSAPSTMSRVESAVSSISETLEDINKANIAGAIDDVRTVAQSASRFLNKADVAKISKSLVGTLDESQIFIARLNELMKSEKINNILPDAAIAMQEFRVVLQKSSADIVAALKNINETTYHTKNVTGKFDSYVNSPEGDKAFEDFSNSLANVEKASSSIRNAAEKFEGTMSRVNMVVAGQQDNIDAIMDNVRKLVENMQELSQEAKQYPSGVLFGDPPRKKGFK